MILPPDWLLHGWTKNLRSVLVIGAFQLSKLAEILVFTGFLDEKFSFRATSLREAVALAASNLTDSDFCARWKKHWNVFQFGTIFYK
jgi:hypothetical protein